MQSKIEGKGQTWWQWKMGEYEGQDTEITWERGRGDRE